MCNDVRYCGVQGGGLQVARTPVAIAHGMTEHPEDLKQIEPALARDLLEW